MPLILQNILKLNCFLRTSNKKTCTQQGQKSPSARAKIRSKWPSLTCIINHLRLNFSKCYKLTFARILSPLIYEYNLGSNKISSVTSLKDLGILFDNKLTFRDHINVTIRKCNKKWGFIRRNTVDFKNWDVIRHLYISLTKSVIMFVSMLWRPFYKNNINRLESIQHRVIRYLAYKEGNPMNRFDHNYSIWLEGLNEQKSIACYTQVSLSLILWKINGKNKV